LHNSHAPSKQTADSHRAYNLRFTWGNFTIGPERAFSSPRFREILAEQTQHSGIIET